MEEGRVRTVVLPDSRGQNRFLRVTWHPDTGTVVFSHWHGTTCTASTQVHVPDGSALIELLAGADWGAAAPR